MKLKLIQTGGFVGNTMTAKVSSKLTESDWAELVKQVKKKSPARKSRMADAFYYTLQKDGDEKTSVRIDLNSIPEKHQELFKTLFEQLKAEK